jgi:hypothetical protein
MNAPATVNRRVAAVRALFEHLVMVCGGPHGYPWAWGAPGGRVFPAGTGKYT